MDKEYFHLVMDADMKVIISKITRKAWVLLNGLMIENISANGKMGNNMEKACSLKMEKRKKDFGKWVK